MNGPPLMDTLETAWAGSGPGPRQVPMDDPEHCTLTECMGQLVRPA